MNSKLFFFFFLTFGSFSTYAQKNIDQVFRKYKNDEGVMNMNFTGDILKMMNSSETKLKSAVEIVDVLIFENKKDITLEDKQKIRSVLTRDKFELLVDVKNKDQKVQLYAIDGGTFLNKVYAHVNTPQMNAYFILSGKIIFEELANLGMDFQSSEPLKILGNKMKSAD